MPDLRLELPAEPGAIAEARRALEPLRADVSPEVWGDLRLLVSEVVTNAVRHTAAAPGSSVVLTVDREPECVRVEVHDGGGGFVAAAEPMPSDAGTSGWGLYLVAKLASHWGTAPEPDPYVWFELPRG